AVAQLAVDLAGDQVELAARVVADALGVHAQGLPTTSLGQAVARQSLVLVARVVGDLAPEPVRRLERVGPIRIGELDLRDDRALERPAVDVELDLRAAAGGDDVAALLDAAALGKRPQPVEALGADLEFLLGALAAGALLDGHHGAAAAAADAHLR